MALPRCYLVHAVAPEGTPAREANDLLNAYVEAPGRGLPVFHDHFTGAPHGGVAVFEVRSEEEQAQILAPGPLSGWALAAHPLTFSLTALGFVAQTELTLEGYGKTTLDALRNAEPADARFWWQRRRA